MLPCIVKLAFHLYPEPFARSATAHPQRLVRVSLPHYVITSLLVYPEPCGRKLITPTESISFTRITPKPNGILLFQHRPRGVPSTTLATTPVHSQSPSAPTTRTNPQPAQKRRPY